WNIRGHFWRWLGERALLVAHRDAFLPAIRPDHQALGEAIHDVVFGGCLDDLAKKTRHIRACDVDQGHRGVWVSGIAHDYGLANVLHPQIPAIELLHFSG